MRYGVTYHPIGAAGTNARSRSFNGDDNPVFTTRHAALTYAGEFPDECQARVVRLVPKKPSYTQMMNTLYKALKDLKQTPRLYGGAEPKTTRTTVLSIVAQFWDAI